jgi:hypothetical protein
MEGAQHATTRESGAGEGACDERVGSAVQELRSQLSYRILWGRVSIAAGFEAGALHGAESILICPTKCIELQRIMACVRDLIPSSLLPRAEDTMRSLKNRLAKTEFLDDIHVLKGGKGPSRIRLNATDYAQPRRVTWSVPVASSETRDDGTIELHCYTQYGRAPDDWKCRLMPSPVCELMLFCWKLAKAANALTPSCASTPPTAVQLMMYYTLFKSAVGRHRDNFSTEHFIDFVRGNRELYKTLESGHSASCDANSHEMTL